LRRFELFDDLKTEIKDRRIQRHAVGRIKKPGSKDGIERGCERVADGTFFLVGVDPPQLLLTSTSQNDATFGYSPRSVIVGRPCPNGSTSDSLYERVSWILCIAVIKCERHSTPRSCNLLKNK